VIGNVNPGYAPSPGKSGTMVVVGTLCS
jgi:hypothetical protein